MILLFLHVLCVQADLKRTVMVIFNVVSASRKVKLGREMRCMRDVLVFCVTCVRFSYGERTSEQRRLCESH